MSDGVTREEKGKVSYLLDLYKLAAIFFVVLLHSGVSNRYVHGYIAVDFFFVVAGFFLGQKIVRNSLNLPVNYLVGKFKKFLPTHVVSLLALTGGVVVFGGGGGRPVGVDI